VQVIERDFGPLGSPLLLAWSLRVPRYASPRQRRARRRPFCPFWLVLSPDGKCARLYDTGGRERSAVHRADSAQLWSCLPAA
jgi:hypothetical protein